MKKKTVLNEIESIARNITESMIKDFYYSQWDEMPLIRALGCKDTSYVTTVGYLLCCISLQGEKRRSLEKEVQEQQNKIETMDCQMVELLEENKKLKKLISTYNGALLQRAKVSGGKPIAKKRA